MNKQFAEAELFRSDKMHETAISPEMSAQFARMSLISAIMVVCLHMGTTNVVDSSGWWFYVVVKQICKMAVPWFFLASGFFLVGHCGGPGWYRRSLCSRVRTLVVPYLIWCAIFSLYFTVVCARKSGFGAVVDQYWITYFGLNPMKAPFYSVMWYFRALIAFVALSPLFIGLLRRFGWLLIGFLWLVDFVFRLNYGMPGSGFFWFVFSLEGAAYFACGIGLRLRMLSFPTWSGRPWFVMCVSCAAVLFLAVFTGLYRCGYPMFCFQGALIPLTLALLWWSVSLVRPRSTNADQLAFPLFLVHGFFLGIISSAVFTDSSSAVHLFLRVICVVLLSTVVVIVMKRTFPRLSTVMFGGR